MSKLSDMLREQAQTDVYARLETREAVEGAIEQRARWYRIAELLVNTAPDKMIQNIRTLRMITSMGLKDAKDMIDMAKADWRERNQPDLLRQRAIADAEAKLRNTITAVANTVGENIDDLESMVGADRLGREIVAELQDGLKDWKKASNEYMKAAFGDRRVGG